MKVKKEQIGSATLYCGDCFDVLPELDVEVDAIISDMPYANTDCDWDVKIPLDKFWAMVESRTKQTANFILFSCGRFTHKLYNSRPDWFRYDLIWQKSKKVGFLWANKMPMRNHESILVFNRPGHFKTATYNPQKTSGGRVGITTRNHQSSVYRDKGEYTHTSDGTLHPCSVLNFRSAFGNHPTEKPVDLMKWLVKSYSGKGDTIVDPFMGSASTGIACVKTGRSFIGIEQNEEYYNIACKRLEEAYAERKEQQ